MNYYHLIYIYCIVFKLGQKVFFDVSSSRMVSSEGIPLISGGTRNAGSNLIHLCQDVEAALWKWVAVLTVTDPNENLSSP